MSTADKPAARTAGSEADWHLSRLTDGRGSADPFPVATFGSVLPPVSAEAGVGRPGSGPPRWRPRRLLAFTRAAAARIRRVPRAGGVRCASGGPFCCCTPSAALERRGRGTDDDVVHVFGVRLHIRACGECCFCGRARSAGYPGFLEGATSLVAASMASAAWAWASSASGVWLARLLVDEGRTNL